MDTAPCIDSAAARIGLIEFQAKKHGIPPALAVAIARVESGLDRYALRHEPAYAYLWDVQKNTAFPCSDSMAGRRNPPPHFPAPAGVSKLTEWIGQQTSWGCMQVMGAVAREYGYRGHLGALCDTLTGADLGCRHLSRLAARYKGKFGWIGVVAAYNAGSPRLQGGRYVNQAYIDKVAAAGGADVLREAF